MRELAYLLLCLAIPPTLTAQEQQDIVAAFDRVLAEDLLPEVTSRLQSDTPAAVAWGGYLAGRYGLVGAVPHVRKALQKVDLTRNTVSVLTRLALLDALIRLDAKPPATELERHLRGRTLYPAMILLGQRPRENSRELMALFRQPAPDDILVWRAAGNLLAATKAPGFAAELLQSLRITLAVQVLTPGHQADAFVAVPSAGGGSASSPYLEVPAGFPPTALYHLRETGMPGDIVLAPGSTPVFYRRLEKNLETVVIPLIRAGTFSKWPHFCEWLQDMTGTDPVSLGLTLRRNVVLRFTNSEDYLHDLRTAREDFHSAWRRVAAKLLQTGALTAKEFQSLKFDVHVLVQDDRDDKSKPLPAVPDFGHR